MSSELLITNGSCPHCGKEISGYMENQMYFGSPIITCKKCKGKYLDRRFHEIAIDGIGNVLSIKRSAKILLIFLALFSIAFIVNFFSIMQSGKYNVKLFFVQILSLFAMVFAIADMVMIKTGMKAKRYEKKKLESIVRLRNIEYAKTLSEFGYEVPDEYLY